MEIILRQLLVQTAQVAQKRFRGKDIRVWYVMLSTSHWKAFIINSVNKVKLAEGPVRETPELAIEGMLNSLRVASGDIGIK
jgi:hypothetical protein